MSTWTAPPSRSAPSPDAPLSPPLPPLRGVGRRPGLRFLFAHPAHVLALGFGSGLPRWAPGTFGTLFAWVVWAWLLPPMGDGAAALLVGGGALVSWWAGTVTAQHLGVADPSAVVSDEVVAFWAVLWLIGPATFWQQAAAFALFRVFDAAKPGPVAWADGLWKSPGGRVGAAQGFGILFDDLVAAFCTLLVIALWRFVTTVPSGSLSWLP